MTEDIKGLIEKIHQEGIRAAEEKAGRIEEEAHLKAEEILKKAKSEAEKILVDAKEEISRMESNTRNLLSQAARDVLLSIRKEINEVLDRVIKAEIRKALTAEELVGIIANLVKNYKEKEDIMVVLNYDDLKKLEQGFISKLKEEIKKEIVLKPSEDIAAGLAISFDSGKSHFDFSDKALTEYIGSYLKPKLKELLKDIP